MDMEKELNKILRKKMGLPEEPVEKSKMEEDLDYMAGVAERFDTILSYIVSKGGLPKDDNF
jgi:hypothetical protein